MDKLTDQAERDIYTFLQTLVQHLGVDGTSSDETETEDGRTIYRAKPLPWRRNIDMELVIIDGLRFSEPDLMSRRGSKPVRRVREGEEGRASLRRPLIGLPRALYDEEWLKGQVHAERLQFSSQPLQWVHILIPGSPVHESSDSLPDE